MKEQEQGQASPQKTNDRPRARASPKEWSGFPQNAVANLQQTIGNQAVVRLLASGGIQAKLASQPSDAAGAAGTAPAVSTDLHRPHSLIVEDDAPSVAPGQMKKSAFFDLLQADVCATADAELAVVGRSTKSCPYIEKWLAFYRGQSSSHIEQALLKYAPEAAGATTARDYIVHVRQRVRQAVATWAKTGEVTGVPPGVGPMPSAAGPAAAAKGAGSGAPQTSSGGSGVQFKEREGASAPVTDAESVRAQLGHGRALDPALRERMGSAFGRDFGSVRVHDDASASSLSSRLNARAFTVGNDVAFGAGEYQPGTLIGDALIAHELAHAVQQDGGQQSSLPMEKSTEGSRQLEEDADQSAVGAVVSGWAGVKKGLLEFSKSAMPRLRSGLRLQACKSSSDGPSFTVVGHGVSDSTVEVARQRMTEILESLKAPNVSALGKVSVELHVIPANKKLTDLPEYTHLKGVRTFDGRLYDDLRGAGGEKVGNTIRYAIAEEQLVPVAGHPSGYAQGFVAGHETGHIVEQYALTKEQSTELHTLFDERTRAGGPWLAPADYTKSNFEEYFAQGAAAYFGHPYTEANRDMYTREWLKTNDLGLHTFLTKIFR